MWENIHIFVRKLLLNSPFQWKWKTFFLQCVYANFSWYENVFREFLKNTVHKASEVNEIWANIAQQRQEQNMNVQLSLDN